MLLPFRVPATGALLKFDMLAAMILPNYGQVTTLAIYLAHGRLSFVKIGK